MSLFKSNAISPSLKGPSENERALVAQKRKLEKLVEEKTASLEAMQGQLNEASRRASTAEVATGVLHNVGNVLNSVSVAASLVREQTNNGTVDRLDRAVALLEQHDEDLSAFLTQDARGEKFPIFLRRLTDTLLMQKKETQERLDELLGGVEHLKTIIMVQQSYARHGGTVDTYDVCSIVEDAIHINAQGLQRHGVEVKQQFDDVQPISTDRQKVLQILVNLISNAKYAMSDVDAGARKLFLSVTNNGSRRIRVTVTDAGVGITEEHLAEVFKLGFTTRRDGHGFGLHSAATAARELGGTLQAQSDGPGKGASFTLELPTSS